MGPSSQSTAIAVTRLRAPGRFRPWALLVDALDLTLAQPRLWLFGALGFMLRGGLVLLLTPLIALPSPVEIRLLIGDGLGSSGFTPAVVGTATVVGLVTAGFLLSTVLGLAWLELWSFERALNPGVRGRLIGPIRWRTVSWLFVAQALALLLIVAAALPLIDRATDVAYRQLVAPTGSGPLYERVLAGVQQPLMLLVAAILLAEAASAIAMRTILGRAVGAPLPVHRRRWRPVVAVLGWTVTVGVLAAPLWLLGAAWQWLSGMLLGSATVGQDGGTLLLATVVLVSAWVGAIVLAGFASALRGALWSMQELR